MTEKAKCCICGHVRDRDEMWILHPTPEEKAAIARFGQVPVDEYLYCRPCWGILSDKEKGAQLLRGMVQMHMRTSGVSAEKAAKKMYQFLISKARTTKAS